MRVYIMSLVFLSAVRRSTDGHVYHVSGCPEHEQIISVTSKLSITARVDLNHSRLLQCCPELTAPMGIVFCSNERIAGSLESSRFRLVGVATRIQDSAV